jgi:hypothetical protein
MLASIVFLETVIVKLNLGLAYPALERKVQWKQGFAANFDVDVLRSSLSTHAPDFALLARPCGSLFPFDSPFWVQEPTLRYGGEMEMNPENTCNSNSKKHLGSS